MTRSISIKLAILALPWSAALGLAGYVAARQDWHWASVVALALGGALGFAALAHRALAQTRAMIRATSGLIASYGEGDFSRTLSWPHRDEIGELVAAHNQLGDAIRKQRLDLVQRELLLSSIVQNNPLAMVLVDSTDRVVFSNLASRRLLHGSKRLEGHTFASILQGTKAAFQHAVAQGQDSVITIGEDDEAELFHLSTQSLALNSKTHRLYLIKQLTQELRRQEVETWKKVLRVISHELNNSLAPIASLTHSAKELVARNQYDRLIHILEIVQERTQHLEGFVRSYTHFAKLPQPRKSPCPWSSMLDSLQAHLRFSVPEALPEEPGHIDQVQCEQALLNLLKNAHESGSPEQEIQVLVRDQPSGWEIEVRDRGEGMSADTLERALVPFYSTKRQGTGIGLALCREIAEAHGGSLALHNRPDGGLSVRMFFPRPASRPRADVEHLSDAGVDRGEVESTAQLPLG